MYRCRECQARRNEPIGTLNSLFADRSHIAEPASRQLHECLVHLTLLSQVTGTPVVLWIALAIQAVGETEASPMAVQ